MLKIGNKVYRNLQEQVAKNMDDIEELKTIIAGLTGYTASNGVKLVGKDIQADTSIMATKDYVETAASDAATDAANGVRKYPYKIRFDVQYESYHNYVDAYLIINPSDFPTTREGLVSALSDSSSNNALIVIPSYISLQGGPTDKGAFVLQIGFNSQTNAIALMILDLNANEVIENEYENWTFAY